MAVELARGLETGAQLEGPPPRLRRLASYPPRYSMSGPATQYSHNEHGLIPMGYSEEEPSNSVEAGPIHYSLSYDRRYAGLASRRGASTTGAAPAEVLD